MLRELFSSGRVIELALGVIAVEVVLLAMTTKRHGLRPGDVLGQLLAGACLLLALRASLKGAPWQHCAAFLTASLPAHLYDLWRRRNASRGD